MSKPGSFTDALEVYLRTREELKKLEGTLSYNNQDNPELFSRMKRAKLALENAVEATKKKNKSKIPLVKSLIQLSDSPSSWEAEDSKGRQYYIKYHYGVLAVFRNGRLVGSETFGVMGNISKETMMMQAGGILDFSEVYYD